MSSMEQWILSEGRSDIRRDLWRGYPLPGNFCIIANRVISKYEADDKGEKNYRRVLGFWTGTDADAMDFMKAMEFADKFRHILGRHKSGQLTDAEAMAEIQTTLGEK